jgi:hypothetical protein
VERHAVVDVTHYAQLQRRMTEMDLLVAFVDQPSEVRARKRPPIESLKSHIGLWAQEVIWVSSVCASQSWLVL